MVVGSGALLAVSRTKRPTETQDFRGSLGLQASRIADVRDRDEHPARRIAKLLSTVAKNSGRELTARRGPRSRHVSSSAAPATDNRSTLARTEMSSPTLAR